MPEPGFAQRLSGRVRSRTRRGAGLVLVLALVLAGCSDAEPGRQPTAAAPSSNASSSPDPDAPASSTPEPSPTRRPERTSANPDIGPLPADQWKRMVKAGMWRPGCPVRRPELRRVEVNHHTFTGGVRRGVLVVNADVAASIARIFTKLFDAGFPIRRMQPVEAYDGDSDASLRDDNTAAYNCRRPSQINAPPVDSPHANGRAIDVNPRENPWQDPRCRCWSPGSKHHARTRGEGKILKGGVAWRAFTDEGWIWQNIDVPDYMHFDTGYPSSRFSGHQH